MTKLILYGLSGCFGTLRAVVLSVIKGFSAFVRRNERTDLGAQSMQNQLALSVVVPLLDEEKGVFQLYEKIHTACESVGSNHEIIFVDDGSTDRTYDILRDIRGADSRVKVIRFRKNYGQTAAMAAGFQIAQGRIVVSLDGDLQNDPADIPNLLQKIEEGYDVVCGWRKNRKDEYWSRLLPSKAANWIIRHITGVKIHDNGCSLKAYRTSIIKRVSLYGDLHRFIPAMSTLAGASIAEIEVEHHPRPFGKSKYGTLSRLWKVILDIMTVKMITSFASRPGLWFGLWSVPFMVIGFIALYLTVQMYLENSMDEVVVMVGIVLLWLGCSVHLLSMGVIGELLVKTGHWDAPTVYKPIARFLSI